MMKKQLEKERKEKSSIYLLPMARKAKSANEITCILEFPQQKIKINFNEIYARKLTISCKIFFAKQFSRISFFIKTFISWC